MTDRHVLLGTRVGPAIRVAGAGRPVLHPLVPAVDPAIAAEPGHTAARKTRSRDGLSLPRRASAPDIITAGAARPTPARKDPE